MHSSVRNDMKVSVRSRSGRDLGSFDLPANATLPDLKKAFHLAHPKYYADRQRFYHSTTPFSSSQSSTVPSKKPTPLAPDASLSDGDKLLFKDLGPQISWRTVFVIEYLGPLLLYPVFYMQPTWIYGAIAPNTSVDPEFVKEVQLCALVAWSFHYGKREIETLFVHRFSNATMPLLNIFKNSGYYWGFAAYVAYFVNHPLYTPPSPDLFYCGMCLFYFMEVGNFSAHWTLRMLRPPGTRIRRIPRGGLFEFVSCPNYTYEICSWIGFNLMTKTVAGILFMCFGAAQMLVWAKNKHRRYKREFDGKENRPLYPPNRRILVPFIY